MKSKLSHYLCLVVILFFTTSCQKETSIDPYGQIISRTHIVAPCTSMEVNNGFGLEITNGDGSQLIIEAPENVHDYLSIRVEGQKLIIQTREGYHFSRSPQVKVKFPTKDIAELITTGGVSAKINGGFSSQSVGVYQSGGGVISGTISTELLTTEFTGGSFCLLSGYINIMKSTISGGGKSNCVDLKVKNMEVTLSGGAELSCSTSETLAYDLSGGSKLMYYGSPTITKHLLTGGSTITQMTKD